jgi:hypothetical protein
LIASLCRDLLGFAAVFIVAWIVYFATHLTAASVGVVRGVGKSTVLLAVAAALLAGIGSWLWLGSWFSSSTVHALVSIVAPFSFIGFCGNYVLVGPVTVDRSITLSMLAALADSKTKGLTREQLRAEVPFDRIFAKRMRELERTRNLTVDGDVRVTERGRRALRFYRWMSRLLKVDFQ